MSIVAAPSASPAHGDILVFPGERIAFVSDFARLHLAARRISFLTTLAHEGITPEHYATMCRRFETARRLNPAVEAEFRRQLGDGR